MASRRWFWPMLAVVLYFPWVDTEVGQGNVASDLAAIESLVSRRTFFINESPFAVTLDKFKRGDLYFSQKSPIYHLAAAVPVALMSLVGIHPSEHPAAVLRVLTLLFVILPMGWLLRLVHTHPWMARLGAGSRLLMTLAFALGSLLTPFCVTFNHYIPASAFLMAAVHVLLAQGVLGAASGRPLVRGLWVGFLVSLSIACDITPGIIFGVTLGVWCAAGLVRRPGDIFFVVGMAAGVLPVAVLYAALNLHIVGSPLPPNMHESEMLYYEGSFWAEQQAKIARGEPDFYEASYGRRVFHALVGYKGIYWMMPLLALVTFVAVVCADRDVKPGPGLAGLLLFPVVTILVVMRWTLDHGGGQYVIRHVFPAIAPVYCAWGLASDALRRGWLRGVVVLCACWGGVVAAIGVDKPWSHNTLSAIPPVENLARFALRHPDRLPTGWIARAIELTSVAPANAWLDLGLERMGRRDLAGAEASFRRAIGADRDYALAYYHLGIVLDMQSRPKEAVVIYERLLELEPNNGGAWNNLGIFSLRMGDAARARSAFEHSMKIAPDNATAMWGLLLLEKPEGRATPDSPLLLRAIDLHPNDARIQAIARERGL